jgi:uncharacterized protein YjdB
MCIIFSTFEIETIGINLKLDVLSSYTFSVNNSSTQYYLKHTFRAFTSSSMISESEIKYIGQLKQMHQSKYLRSKAEYQSMLASYFVVSNQ